jgi:hypothetical protein
MKNKTTIDSLRVQLSSVEGERIKLLNEIQDLEDKEALPALKKKYSGHYWKYKNSYGPPAEGWWLYSFCRSIKGQNTGVFNTFQSCKYGKHEFNVGEETGFHLCQVKITKKEYDRAFKIFLETCKRLNP